jgi:hypothetical protein
LHCQEKKFPENSLHLSQTKSIKSVALEYIIRSQNPRLGFWTGTTTKPGLKTMFFSRGDYFRFNLVFIKKNNQTEICFFKKPKPVQTDRFRFGSVWFLWQKPVQAGLTRFFGLARFFQGFFRFGFSFFGFRLIKPKPNRTGRFLKKFNWFFFTIQFFQLFSWFFNFFSHLYFSVF